MGEIKSMLDCILKDCYKTKTFEASYMNKVSEDCQLLVVYSVSFLQRCHVSTFEITFQIQYFPTERHLYKIVFYILIFFYFWMFLQQVMMLSAVLTYPVSYHFLLKHLSSQGVQHTFTKGSMYYR